MSDYDYNYSPYNNERGNPPPYGRPPYYAPAPPPQQPPEKKKKGIGGIIAAVLAVGVIAGSLVTGFIVVPLLNQPREQSAEAAAPEQESSRAPEAETLPQMGGDKAEIQNVVNPVPEIAAAAQESVVGIATYEQAFVSGQEPIEQAISSGTGFVVSEDGYIVTNNHVVAGGSKYRVTDYNGNEFDAELIGRDEYTEIAVLKVENLGLGPIAIGDSNAVQVGELVVAIGNPLGQELSGTVTVGYLSGLHRAMTNPSSDETFREDLLQTDAAVNPGNSGGPLLNSSGEVIGVNVMKAGGSTVEGLSFAIPINSAMETARALIADGSVPAPVKPGIGFTSQKVTAEDAQNWGTPRGIIVREIVPGSPAQKAGLQVQDIITSLDGVDLTAGADTPTFENKQVGDIVQADVWRYGQGEIQIEFEIADLNALE